MHFSSMFSYLARATRTVHGLSQSKTYATQSLKIVTPVCALDSKDKIIENGDIMNHHIYKIEQIYI